MYTGDNVNAMERWQKTTLSTPVTSVIISEKEFSNQQGKEPKKVKVFTANDHAYLETIMA